MKREDVIRMAREADRVGAFKGPIARDWYLAKLVAAAEREECADLCSAQVQIEKYGHAAHAALMCEQSIREKGKA